MGSEMCIRDRSEAQAYRYLQKTSMDNSVRLIQTAQAVLESTDIG